MGLAALFWRVTWFRYVGASATALCVDLALFMTLRLTSLPIAVVTAIGYVAGTATHWLISSRLVFADGLRETGVRRGRQQIMFGLSALAGLLVTVAIVGVGDALGLDARLAKLIAIVVNFQATYILRSRVVFA